MNRTIMCFALPAMLLVADACVAQVFSLKEWDERATKIFQENEDRQKIEPELRKLLESKSIPFLIEILNQPDFHPLRLAAFYVISSKHPQLELKALLLLLAESQHALLLYDAEFERLSDLLKTPEKGDEVNEFLRRNFDGEHEAVLRLVLKIVPSDQLLLVLQNRNKSPIPASNLAAVIDRICGTFPKWRETEMRTEIIAGLQDIKDSPGYCQVSMLEHFPFENDSDAIKHLRYVFNDETLPDAVAVLSARQFQKLVASAQHELLVGNKELASRRLAEFKKRFPVQESKN